MYRQGTVPAGRHLFGVASGAGETVPCTNPAALSGGDLTDPLDPLDPIDPVDPSAPFAPGTLIGGATGLLHLTLPRPATTWISSPGAYTAHCTSGSGPHVLRITLHAPARRRAGAPLASLASPTPDANRELHLLDANTALGNLLTTVRRETRAYETTAGRQAPQTRS